MTGSRRSLWVAVVVALGWVALAGVLGPLTGRLSEVQTNDNASFLPADAEATEAREWTQRFNDTEVTPAIVVYERSGGLTQDDLAIIQQHSQEFGELPDVATPLPPPVTSDDGEAVRQVVPLTISEGTEFDIAVEQLREIATAGAPDGLNAYVGGPAGLLADLVAVFKTVDLTLVLVTASVVLVILLLVYRSPILWLIPMLSVSLSYVAAAAVVYGLARADLVDLNGQAQGILTVLVFGAGTDYALLLIARYREELRTRERPVDALLAALRGAAPAIIASAFTVAAGLSCLLLSELDSNRALGPVAAAGIVATLVVTLTFLPALALLGGRWAFWPSIPRVGDTTATGRGLWERVAQYVGRRPRVAWGVPTLGLVALLAGLLALTGSSVPPSEQFTTTTDSARASQVLAQHFPSGSGTPAEIIARADYMEAVISAVEQVEGVTEVVPYTGGAPDGPPVIVDGRVLLNATLQAPSDSAAAEQTVIELREAVHAVPDADALVGGFTAVEVDTQQASQRDRTVIIPLVLAVIAVILAVLLRAIVAPLVLIATVVLSFAATLGACALLFEYVFDFPGAEASFPLFAFVFLVALGIDYNIFLMSRVREESIKSGTRTGTLRGLAVTGGVITSAGIVLAATFSALAILPLVVLVELGVAVSLGVLIDTIVVRSLLVPALAIELGDRVWWPSSLSRRARQADPA